MCQKGYMTIEIEETKLKEMEEDLNNYILLIKEYDNSIKIKNELIKRYEKELGFSRNIINELLNDILKLSSSEEVARQIGEIKQCLV